MKEDGRVHAPRGVPQVHQRGRWRSTSLSAGVSAPNRDGVLSFFGAIYRYSGNGIITLTTKSTRVPESMAGRPADNFKGA